MSEKHSWTVTGCAAHSVEEGNYGLEKMIEEKFGSEVFGDSEHSQLYVYCTPEVVEEVLAFAKEHGKEGELFHTYGAGSFPASFTAYEG
jgi:hypothetical protein